MCEDYINSFIGKYFVMWEGKSLSFSEIEVGELKAEVESHTGVPVAEQVLTFGGKVLVDGDVYDYGVQKVKQNQNFFDTHTLLFRILPSSCPSACVVVLLGLSSPWLRLPSL